MAMKEQPLAGFTIIMAGTTSMLRAVFKMDQSDSGEYCLVHTGKPMY